MNFMRIGDRIVNLDRLEEASSPETATGASLTLGHFSGEILFEAADARRAWATLTALAPGGDAPAAPADWRAAVPAELHRELADALRVARLVSVRAELYELDRNGAALVVERLEKIAAMIAMPGDDDAGS